MKYLRFLVSSLLVAAVFSAAAIQPALATNNDRFIKVTAKGLNESLFAAITNGDIGGSPTWFQEAPSGSCNGSNVTFTAAHTPASAMAVELFLDGLIQRNGVGLDFSVSGATITLGTACASGQLVWIKYN